MLRQGAPAPEFADADALKAHYRALHARTWAPRAVPATPETSRTRALAEAQREREQRESAEREAAALVERERVRALTAQVLTPEHLARDPRSIIAEVAAAFGFTYADIVGRCQVASMVRARWAAISAVRAARPDLTLTVLGRAFGGRDHSAIENALRKMSVDGVPQAPTVLDPMRIIEDVAAAFGFTGADILGPRQRVPLVRARWAAIAAVREARPDLSLYELARVFGDRDYTTVRHAVVRMAAEGVPQPPAQGEPA
ncbi:hypothetical protein MKK75_03245 [Methylobacterium sp. J-030]|uniref:helix-turn-helix domain-containing protein n=1 Tax=Methylobacterium sp. J-030 TaxID=2836627 RepID=UPI001FB9867F|nr:helix-turn-helix domain-containing protein [Methylobacterium sp. J-030]MCJ2067832.1 hypothetical protein [Methylobacterium sp. J-030]